MTLTGRPIEVRYRSNLRDTSGNPAHAATFIRHRLIVLERELRRSPPEHQRILVHELFHFVWVRLGNNKRRNWEGLLRAEWNAHSRGEAGWSAEWRKLELRPADPLRRTRKWREYCCESFCDTGASIQTGIHAELTLAAKPLAIRRSWFAEQLPKSLPV